MMFLVSRLERAAHAVGLKTAEVFLDFCDSLDKRLYKDFDLEMTGAELLAAYEENTECFEPDDIWLSKQAGLEWRWSGTQWFKDWPKISPSGSDGEYSPAADDAPPAPAAGHLTTDWAQWMEPAILDILSEHMFDNFELACRCNPDRHMDGFEWREHTAPILAQHLEQAMNARTDKQ